MLGNAVNSLQPYMHLLRENHLVWLSARLPTVPLSCLLDTTMAANTSVILKIHAKWHVSIPSLNADKGLKEGLRFRRQDQNPS